MALLLRGGQVLDGARGARPAPTSSRRRRHRGGGRAPRVPAGAEVIDASGRHRAARPHQRPHPRPQQPPAGPRRHWTLEDLLNHAAAINSFRDRRGPLPLGRPRCRRDAQDRLHVGLRPLHGGCPRVTDEIDAVVRAYTDVGMRAVLAPAVADIVFYETVPGLLDLLPTELRRRVEDIAAGAHRGAAGADASGHPPLARRRRWAHARRRLADDPHPVHRRVPRRLRRAGARVRRRPAHALAESKVQAWRPATLGQAVVASCATSACSGPASWARTPSG